MCWKWGKGQVGWIWRSEERKMLKELTAVERETDGMMRREGGSDDWRRSESRGGQSILILTCVSCSGSNLTWPLNIGEAGWTRSALQGCAQTKTHCAHIHSSTCLTPCCWAIISVRVKKIAEGCLHASWTRIKIFSKTGDLHVNVYILQEWKENSS